MVPPTTFLTFLVGKVATTSCGVGYLSTKPGAQIRHELSGHCLPQKKALISEVSDVATPMHEDVATPMLQKKKKCTSVFFFVGQWFYGNSRQSPQLV